MDPEETESLPILEGRHRRTHPTLPSQKIEMDRL